jgi:hypothetical protein
VKCYNCQKKAYYARDCPDKKADGKGGKGIVLMVGDDASGEDNESSSDCEDFSFHQSKDSVNKNWILLDNCSTTDIVCNKKLLSNIRNSNTTFKIHCNAGSKVVDQVGTLCNYVTVWYSKDAIANIL